MKKSGFTPTPILTLFRFLKTVFTNSNIFSKILLSHKSHSETKKQHQDWCRGLTVIELMLVVTVIGIISGVIVASLNSARNKGGATVIRTQLAQVRTTMTQHYADFGFYPPLTAVSPYDTGIAPTMGHIFQWYAVDGATPCSTCFDAIVKNSFAAIKGQINTNAGSNLNTIYYEINENQPGKAGFTIGVFGRDGNFHSITETGSKTLTSGVTGRAAGTQGNLASTISSITATTAALIVDESPTSLPFTDQTGVNITTLTLSNIIPITGIDTIVAVSLSGDSSSEFRTCSTDSCTGSGSVIRDWGTGATTINPGQFLQLRLTSSFGASTAVSATITVGTLSRTWIVTTLLPFSAAGGTVTMSGNFAVHTFRSSGTFTPSISGNVEVLVVAGGGGTGSSLYHNGGGGGGGVVYHANKAVSAGGITVTVGNGGTGGASGGCCVSGTNGQNSLFSDITAIGGGFGGRYSDIPGSNGGSGGGGAENGGDVSHPAGLATQGNSGGGTGYGNAGGAGFSGGLGGGGGGGAGAVGGTGVASTRGGNGGIGFQSSISGSSTYYAGGGGGANYYSGSGNSSGGLGGGGLGWSSGSNGGDNSANAAVNTGGGAGAYERADNRSGGIGGSGIVIVRYLATSFVDMTRVALSTVIPSNILQISGISGSIPVSITTGNSAQFRICSDSTCSGNPAWGNSATTITNNQWLQLRLTSSGSINSSLSATITVGAGSRTWSVTTASFYATGGTITTSGNFAVHTFTSSGSFIVSGSGNVEYLVVAGGGGGGPRGGGGGAGGMRTATSIAVTAQTYSIVVGAGGAQSTDSSSGGTAYSGVNSSALGIISTGGGAGGLFASAGIAGGSGGGVGRDSGGTGGAGTAGQGNSGGTGAAVGCSGGGGGGGSKGVGGNSTASTERGGQGGIATANNISGSYVSYAGGGGGGASCLATDAASWGLGGGTTVTADKGGGGNGSLSGSARIPVAGVANTGGGGGGGGDSGGFGGGTYTGAPGGSGIVIIRYIP